MGTEFKEEQKFNQWWIRIVSLAVGIVPIIGIYKQLILGEKFGNKPISNIELIVVATFTFALIILFYSIKLKTKIDAYGIEIIFFPFINKKIKWNEIKDAKVIDYGFVGGWGIRLWTKYGTIYNIKGKKGLAIELRNGKKILVGTQKEAELRITMEKHTGRMK